MKSHVQWFFPQHPEANYTTVRLGEEIDLIKTECTFPVRVKVWPTVTNSVTSCSYVASQQQSKRLVYINVMLF